MLQVKRFPNILIISHNPLSMHFNNGKTLYSLFKDFPKDNIAQLYFQREIPDSNKFENFYRITDYEILEACLFLRNKEQLGEVILPQNSFTHSISEPRAKAKIFNFIKKNISLLCIVRNIIYGTGLWKSKKLLNWIEEFKPDIIFFLGGNFSFSFRITTWISERYKIPYVIYITDDYILHQKIKNLFDFIVLYNLRKCYRHSIAKVHKLFVIGDEMAKEFGAYFLRDCIPIMNSIEFTSNLVPTNNSNNNKIVIVYTGGLHLNRWKKLIEFGELIKECEGKINKKILIEIYSIHPPSVEILNKLNVAPLKYGGALIEDHLLRKLKEADFLLHVESDEKEYRLRTKLSVSTKISEYLAQGKCIIAFGPSDVASLKLIKENKIGICLTDTDSHETKVAALINIFTSETMKYKIGISGFYYAYEKFNAQKNRDLMRSILE